MKILIWQAFGDVDVCCVETLEQLDKIFSAVLNCIRDKSGEEMIKLIKQYSILDNNTPKADVYKKKKSIIKAITDLNWSNESFEKFYFTEVQYL